MEDSLSKNRRKTVTIEAAVASGVRSERTCCQASHLTHTDARADIQTHTERETHTLSHTLSHTQRDEGVGSGEGAREKEREGPGLVDRPLCQWIEVAFEQWAERLQQTINAQKIRPPSVRLVAPVL